MSTCKPLGNVDIILELINDDSMEGLTDYLNQFDIKDVINTSRVWNPLQFATFQQNEKAIELILDHGGNIDITDDNGVTSVMLATEYAHIDCVKLLINRGADLVKVNNKGETAVAIAIRRDLPEIKRLLQEALGTRHPILK